MKFFPVALLASALCLAPVVALAQNEIAPPSQARVAKDAFVWHFAPPVGSRWQIRSFARSKSKSVTPFPDSTPDEHAELNDLRSVVADYDVLNRDQFGAMTSRITLRETRFDSSGIADGEELASKFPAERLAALQKTLQNVSFTIKQSPTGEVWGVAGREAINNRIANAIAPFNSGDATQILVQSQKMTDFLIGLNPLRQMLGLAQAPSYPIVTSESWPYQVALPDGFQFGFDLAGQSKLNRLTPESAFIASNATYDASNAQVAPVFTRENGNFIADASGIKASVRTTSRVERSSGLTLESTSSWLISSTIVSHQRATVTSDGRIGHRNSHTVSAALILIASDQYYL